MTDVTEVPIDLSEDAAPEAFADDPTSDAELVPAWLALLVVVLFIALAGVGGFVVRGLLAGDLRPTSPQDADIAKWTEAVKADANDLDARVSLGYSLQQAGRYDKALDAYKYVIEKDPNNTAAHYNSGVIYDRLGSEKKAEAEWSKVLEIDKTHALAAKSLGKFYAKRSHYKSLLYVVLPAADANPEMADLQYLVALAYENLGDSARATEYYKAALKYSPDMKEASDGLDRLGVVSK